MRITVSALFHRVDLPVGGRERIRTSGRLTPTPDFESGAFNHSATLPTCSTPTAYDVVNIELFGPVLILPSDTAFRNSENQRYRQQTTHRVSRPGSNLHVLRLNCKAICPSVVSLFCRAVHPSGRSLCHAGGPGAVLAGGSTWQGYYRTRLKSFGIARRVLAGFGWRARCFA